MALRRYGCTGRMSQVTIWNDMIYLSGIVSEKEGVEAQTKDILDTIEGLLNKYDSDKKHILLANIYLKDMNDFKAMNSVWDNWVVNNHEPSRATVEAKLAREELLVEIQVVATKVKRGIYFV